MDLQFLFEEPINEIVELSPGYEDHASDVWSVKTDNQEVVVRSSRLKEESNNEFWWGCRKLFGIDPRQVHELEHVNNKLSDLSSIPVPRVINKGKAFEREFVVVEKLKGKVVQSFIDQPSSVLQSLGEGLAKIHTYNENYIGNPSGSFNVRLEDFHQHVKDIIAELVSMFYLDQERIKDKLLEINDLLDKLPAPESSTFVLVDMDPTQFLADSKVITGLVDTEAYVIAPRELDFIALEYVLDEKAAMSFKAGYESVMEIPNLTLCRTAYRYLYRLLSVQGSVDIDDWINHKTLF
ncbi:aminoglycoside phosphotransferase family protein [Sporosarcina sp. NPDC096371]|uniref:aminoglycoside phosphotransferase family protein n=1 Tax=Sporosarcina sp. NPDC096371 TaxID=3364530 RepID=UPI0037F24062